MNKYYTRACNFYFGINAKQLIKKKKALPLCGNSNIAFDKIEVITRKINKVKSTFKKYVSKNIVENFDVEVTNFLQVCPKEMIDKLENPITNKSIVGKAS